MAAYGEFAYWYDRLNGGADYDTLEKKILDILHGAGIDDGILLDAGCGTGELSLWLARAGYDVIAVDLSFDMLSVLREKATEQQQDILLLCQDLTELDLYGTIRAAVSTFDTFSHLTLEQAERAIERIALFMEPGGVLVFDVNTPYKHQKVLANNQFEIEDGADDDILCCWTNTYNKEDGSVDIVVEITQQGRVVCQERFSEYAYSSDVWEKLLQKYGFGSSNVMDGERFGALAPDSERALFTAIKKERI